MLLWWCLQPRPSSSNATKKGFKKKVIISPLQICKMMYLNFAVAFLLTHVVWICDHTVVYTIQTTCVSWQKQTNSIPSYLLIIDFYSYHTEAFISYVRSYKFLLLNMGWCALLLMQNLWTLFICVIPLCLPLIHNNNKISSYNIQKYLWINFVN